MRTTTALRRRADPRRGGTLLMFVMLVFAFFAIAGVAVDIGMASLTQSGMQVAVDTAALEGMRLRQAEYYVHQSDHNGNHLDRRAKASRLVQLVFDDDLHPTGIPASANDPQSMGVVQDDADTLQLGAGPAMQVPGPLGDQTISFAPQSPVFDDPKLRWNTENKQWGDMVSGMYVPGGEHVEDVTGDYDRPDFVPAPTAGGPIEQGQQLGFLVRMRRTDARNPRDKDLSATYFARTVPFLFGIGSLMRVNQEGYDPRRHGITLRATAIAVGRPALRASAPPLDSAGVPIPDEGQHNQQEYLTTGTPPPPMLGLYPFAMPMEAWLDSVQLTPTDTWQEFRYLERDGAGNLLDADTLELVGRFAEFGTSVGQELVWAGPSTIAGWQTSGYVAIYEDVPGPAGVVQRIVGYGFCEAGESSDIPGQIRFRTGIKEWGNGGEMNVVTAWVAANGVSARLDTHAPQLTAQEWEFVLARNRFLAYGPCETNPTGEVTYDHDRIRPGTLLASTLAR